jgi:diguanylate cyclase (GGDEF)-like protein
MNKSFSVLVIDDEVINLKIISDALRGEVKVIVANNGLQGIRKAQELQPDLIILDVVMPDMDGFEIIRKLHANNSTASIPVIFITSLSDMNNEEKGLLLGASDYLQKPIKAPIVKARVRLHLQLAHQRRMLERLAHLDPLTSIANRRRYQEVFELQWNKLSSIQSPLTLVILDIDDFKHYNDTYGHSAGDIALQQVAIVLTHHFQGDSDFVARFGGEEFIVLMPEVSAEEARSKLDQCIKAVKDLKLDNQKGQVITLSAGGVTTIPTPNQDPQTFFEQADNALYVAKRAGKNRSHWHEDRSYNQEPNINAI